MREGLVKSMELLMELDRMEEYFLAVVDVDRCRSWLTSAGSIPSFSAAS